MTDFVILGFAGLGVGKPFMEQGTGGIACQCDVDCIAVFLQLNLGILAAFKTASITWVVLTRRAVCKTETTDSATKLCPVLRTGARPKSFLQWAIGI